METVEKLEEGWVKFTRYNCTDGCIDIWTGDCVDNPNNDNKSRLNLNAFATFVRLNGNGRWYPNDYRKGIRGFTMEMCQVATSVEIWNEISKYNYEDNGE